MNNSLKDRILDESDIVAVIDERIGGLTRKGREYVGLCPFHADHRPSMSVSPQKRIFKCWSCGAGGDVIRFVEMYDRVDFREALRILAQRAGIDIKATPTDPRAAEQRDALRSAVQWARDHFRRNLASSAGRAAREYAQRRGLSDATIETFGLGLALDSWDDLLRNARSARLPDDALQAAGLIARNEAGRVYDRFRNRLIFPIHDEMGRPVAFGGRTLGDDNAKYLNSPETPLFSKSRILFGLDQARRAIDTAKAAIVVEGYMDAVLLRQHGFEHVVATLGTALTDAHVKQLQARADTVYLCFDGDTAGVRAADRAVAVALRSRADVRVVLLSGGEDPADCVQQHGAEAFEALLKDARDALEFKWSQTLKAYGHGSRQDRQVALEEFVRFIVDATRSGNVTQLQQNMLVGQMSDLLRVPGEEVLDLLTRARRTYRAPRDTPADDAAATSEYEVSIRGLPSGLVSAVETVLGLLATEPACWQWINDDTARAAAYSRTWQRLYRVCLDVHEDVGEYSRGDVLACCDDSALLELVSRTLAHTRSVVDLREHFLAAHAHLESELRALKMSELRDELHETGGDDADAYQALFAGFDGQDWNLPAEVRSGVVSPALRDSEAKRRRD